MSAPVKSDIVQVGGIKGREMPKFTWVEILGKYASAYNLAVALDTVNGE